MERFNRRLVAFLEHHQQCEERDENAGAKKDQCPSSGEHAPPKKRPGDEPDKVCLPSTPSPSREDEPLTEESLLSSHSGSGPDYKPAPPSPSREDEPLTEESLLSSHSGSDPDYKPPPPSPSREDEPLTEESLLSSHSGSGPDYKPAPPSPSREDEPLTEESLLSNHSESDPDYKPSSPSSSEDEVLTVKSQPSRHSAPEKHHSRSSSSKTKIGEAEDQKAKDAPEMKVKKQRNRRWTEQERAAVHRRLGKFIKRKTLPKKKDCLMCIGKESSVLRERTWRHVKYFVNNEIRKIKGKKRKLEDERERG